MNSINNLKWTLSNLIHLLLGDEKAMSNADWYYYIGNQMDSYVDELRNSGELTDSEEDEEFYVSPHIFYVTELLKNSVYIKLGLPRRYIPNKEFNAVLKEVGDSYAKKTVVEEFNKHKGIN